MDFKVRISPSGHEFDVSAEETILDAALRHGLNFPYGCRSGVCGACKTRLIAGEVDYSEGNPAALTQQDFETGMALCCQARATSNLELEVKEITGSQEIPVKTMPCRVVKKEQLAHDVIRLYLKLPTDERLQFLAGQYIDILLKDGRHRSFSLANAPHDDEFLELHIRHIDGGEFTDFVFAAMEEKAVLRFEGPHGQFYLREDSDKPVIFVAGGTGFAPIKGIIEHMLAAKIDRPIHLYWGARAKRDLYMTNLPEQWVKNHRHIHFVPVLSDPAPEDVWQGRIGFVHQAVLEDFADMSPYQVYAGGSPAMVNAAYQAFVEKGMGKDQFFSDAFTLAADNPAKNKT